MEIESWRGRAGERERLLEKGGARHLVDETDVRSRLVDTTFAVAETVISRTNDEIIISTQEKAAIALRNV